jgi:hypothetical protein
VKIGCPEPADHVRLAAFGDQIEDVGLITALNRQQGGEEPDGPGAGDKHSPGDPRRPAADLFDVIPRLRDDGGRFQQHTQGSQRGIDFHQVLRVNTVPVGRVPVAGLDSPLRVPAVEAHVPVADGACRAGDGVGPPHDADNQVGRRKSGVCRGLDHPPQ